MIRALARKSTALFSGLLISKLISTAIFVILARQLQPALFGQAGYYLTLISLVTLLADFGLNQWYQKQAVHRDHTQLLEFVFSARLMTLTLSLAVTAVFLTVSHTFSGFVSVMLLLTLITEGWQSTFDGYYLVKKQVAKVSLKPAIKLTLFIILTHTFNQWANFDSLTLFLLLSSGVTLIWYWPRLLYQRVLFNWRSGLMVLKQSSQYAVLILTSFAYARSDGLIIQNTLGSSFLGVYSAAYRYLESVALLPSALAQNLFHLSAKPGEVSLVQLKKITTIMLGLGGVSAGILFILSDYLTIGLLGPSYAPAADIVRIMTLVVILFFVNSPLSTVVQSSSQMLKFLPWGMVNTGFNIGLNICLIPIFGIQAAAYVMLTTEITGFLINLYFVKKVYQKR